MVLLFFILQYNFPEQFIRSYGRIISAVGTICFTRNFNTTRVQLRKSPLSFMIACLLHQISLHGTKRTRVRLQTSHYRSL
ncbi:LOW QUALITY PROTEIN: hypothetical protein V1477_001422 [Vespula maculifrons]|uniref:Uncharacterized protein n=1 Tax=Vespula maculifrons TaxID=7453 RepID=A0ABD2D040_VESMC